jgi:hypothetical protein
VALLTPVPTLTLTPSAPLAGMYPEVRGEGFLPNTWTRLSMDGVGTSRSWRTTTSGSFLTGPPALTKAAGTHQVLIVQQYVKGVWVEPSGTRIEFDVWSPLPPPSAPPSTPPVVTVGYVAVNADPIPAYRATITDSTWKTRIRRITSSSGQRHAYAKVQPYNADGSKIMVRPNLLIDARTYDATSHSLPAEARWSSTDPDVIWGVVSGGAGFVRHRVSTGQSTTLRSFSGFGQLRIGTNEGNVDDNDRFVVLNEGAHFVVYDIVNNTYTEHNISQYGGLDNISISHSGEYIVAVWNASGSARGQGMELLRRDATFVRQLTSHGGSHGDFARDAAGNDVWVVCNAPDMRAYRLDTFSSTQLLPPTPAFARGHVSGRMSRRPGWAGFSDYGGLSGAAGYGQLALVKLDGSRQAEVYGFTHHYDDRGATYAAQPQACWNLDGTRVIFASNWGVSGGPVYDFEATV